MNPKEEGLPDESQFEEPKTFAKEPTNNGRDSKVMSNEDTDDFGVDDD